MATLTEIQSAVWQYSSRARTTGTTTPNPTDTRLQQLVAGVWAYSDRTLTSLFPDEDDLKPAVSDLDSASLLEAWPVGSDEYMHLSVTATSFISGNDFDLQGNGATIQIAFYAITPPDTGDAYPTVLDGWRDMQWYAAGRVRVKVADLPIAAGLKREVRIKPVIGGLPELRAVLSPMNVVSSL